MIIEPRIRGFVCITAHPDGCAAKVASEIDFVRSNTVPADGPRKVLVIGASTGYGLSSRITAAFGYGAATLGIFFERPSVKGKPASAGWYNSVAFEQEAQKAGLYAKSINGDAFSDELKEAAIERIREDLGEVDLVIYSLASPRRTDPRSGETYRSVLKPISEPYTNSNLDTDKGIVEPVEIEAASEEEIASTIKVMGGEDWEWWMDALAEAGVLAKDAQTVAYSYIGPKLTWPIYTNGTIGKAKLDLERAARAIKDKHATPAFVSINKALVTQASSAIPVVPLYISILFKLMKAKGTHEGCIEQIVRLFNDHLYSASGPSLDEAGRIRVDDWEMDPAIQAEIEQIWPQVNTENLSQLTDYEGYQKDFLTLFGFGLEGVDYAADVDPDRPIPSIPEELS
jgi:enoyl-[acyl-carrier protein] reductase/trans-2-enoyl-CoA reductase (NAD+)